MAEVQPTITLTLTERDFYRDAWAYTYPAPFGFPYADALAIVLTRRDA